MSRKRYPRRYYNGSRSKRNKVKNDQETTIALGLIFLLLFGGSGITISKKYSSIIVTVFIICIIFILGFIVFKHIRSHKKRLQQISTVNSINDLLFKFKSKPLEFEHYVADVFRLHGYKAKVTPGSGDCGKDIILEKGNKKYVVEVKLYSINSKIDRPKIQKLHSACVAEKADKAFFVTTSNFTQPAINFAKDNKIDLINGAKLIKMIEHIKITHSY